MRKEKVNDESDLGRRECSFFLFFASKRRIAKDLTVFVEGMMAVVK
jgi:hypothetical protein